MKYKQFVFNPIQVNTWVVHDEHGDCAVFDPGCHDEREESILIDYLDKHELQPSGVIATHCHFDHILGVSFLKAKYNCSFKAHQSDQVLLDHALDQGRLFGFNLNASNLIIDELLEGGG
ncbi:MAG: MBL fold metallo-hydrolase, partial [Bacteroidales bacterium]|nr:MBL fold metallo-hydrolase [Bacteroidales bacterium]